jgi:hypothetical protein
MFYLFLGVGKIGFISIVGFQKTSNQPEPATN